MKLGKSIAVQQKLRLERQRMYMRALQESIPDAHTQLRGVLRGSTSSSPRLADQAATLSLPRDWLSGASEALVSSLDGVVPRSAVRDTDWFLSSLLHPSFLRLPPSQQSTAQSRDSLRRLRQRYAMPPELILCGTASLRLAREAVGAVNTAATTFAKVEESASRFDNRAMSERAADSRTSPRAHAVTPADLASFPVRSHRQRWILFDPSLAQNARTESAAHGDGVPPEVLVTAETALCGAIALTCGPEVLFAYLDRCMADVPSVTATPS